MRIPPRSCLFFFLFRGFLFAQPLLYEGLGISTDIQILKKRLPTARHQFMDKDGHISDPGNPAPGESGRYMVRIAPGEPLGLVQYIELDLANGATRRIRFSFERPATSNRFSMAAFENRHPTCATLLRELTTYYGKPQGPKTGHEERLENRLYSWNNSDGELTLFCGRYFGRQREFAMEILLTKGSTE